MLWIPPQPLRIRAARRFGVGHRALPGAAPEPRCRSAPGLPRGADPSGPDHVVEVGTVRLSSTSPPSPLSHAHALFEQCPALTGPGTRASTQFCSGRAQPEPIGTVTPVEHRPRRRRTCGPGAFLRTVPADARRFMRAVGRAPRTTGQYDGPLTDGRDTTDQRLKTLTVVEVGAGDANRQRQTVSIRLPTSESSL